MEMKTTLNSAYLLVLEPRGVYIGIRGTGGQGIIPGPKRDSGRGHTVAARCPVGPLSGDVAGFGFLTPGFDRISSLGQWLS